MKTKKELKKLKQEHDSFVTEEEKAELALKHEKRLVKVHSDAKITKKKYAQLLKDHDELQDQIDFVRELDLASVKSVPIEPKHSSKTSESTAVMLLGDVHAFELVNPKKVNYCNEYSPAICRKSLHSFFRNGLRLVEINRAGTKIDDLLLPMLGDLMNGYIHDDFKEVSAGTPQEEMRFLYGELSEGIDFLLKNGKFKKIIITGNSGNHGRATKFTNISNMTANSNEILLYHMLADKYKNNKKIEFVIADGYHIYQDVYGYKLRIHHGDAIRYAGGILGAGLPIAKAINNWNVEYTADLDLMGHFHSIQWGSKFLVNSSMVGYGTYAKIIKAPYSEPSQTFALIDKKRFLTVVSPIFVR